MALVFGLSLSNHWPLMLLAAPAFAVLLWPRRNEVLKRLGLLSWFALLGLIPYLWMIRRSWAAVPIGFYGPLETIPEIMFLISRAGYAGVDTSASADWMDRVKFFQFFGGQLLLQFAILGTALAAIGFTVQWRLLGRPVAVFLTLAFLMCSAVLVLLLGFDYSAATKHVFSVYPLPAYAVFALWMGLGFAWLARRYALRRGHAAAGGAAVLVLILALGARNNLFTSHDWGARYAQTILRLVPQNAVVFGQGEVDMGPMAYFHMIENWRPDITLYQSKGLVLGNRLFHPLRTDEKSQQRTLRDMIDMQTDPVVFTLDGYSGNAQLDRWLYIEVDKSSTDPLQVTVDIPDEAVRFFEESIAREKDPNAWVAFFQGELRRRYGLLLARSLQRDRPPDERTRRHLDLLAKDFQGALGIAEGMLLNKDGYSVGAVGTLLDAARAAMPSDASKSHVSRFFYLRGVVRANMGDRLGATQDLDTAVAVWPREDNKAIEQLENLYREVGDEAGLKALQGRIKRSKSLRPAP
jgi:hypothetical protein